MADTTSLRELLDRLPLGESLPSEPAINQACAAVAAAWLVAKVAKEGGSAPVALDAIERLSWQALEALAGEPLD